MPITLTISNAAGTINRSRTFPISDADILRIANAFKNPLPSAAGPSTPLTNNQALDAWLAWTMDNTKAFVLASEQESAKTAVAPITTS
jgi:hypothetical protein